MNLKRHISAAFLLAAILLLSALANAAQPTILHAFTSKPEGGPGYDGSGPQSLLAHNGSFYGVTFRGGVFGGGSLFTAQPDGSNFKTLRSFGEDFFDTVMPESPLIVAGNVLYGVSPVAGFNLGCIFSINTDGSDYRVLYSFPNPEDAYEPRCELTIQGDTLYGTTVGSLLGGGAVFAVKTNGFNFRVLHSFDDPESGSAANGAKPFAGLTLVDKFLYGSTSVGGLGSGLIFRVDTNGANFSVLHRFAPLIQPPDSTLAFNADGAGVQSKILFADGRLYGVTTGGGASGNGTIFTLKLDGSEFRTLHTFARSAMPFTLPDRLCLLNGVIYGCEAYGGTYSEGRIFQFDLKTAAFKSLFSFTPLKTAGPGLHTNAYGTLPRGVVVLQNSLYYTAALGGAFGSGVLGRLDFDVAPAHLGIAKTEQDLRIDVYGDSGRTYILEQTEDVLSGFWTNPVNVLLEQNPQPVHLPNPSSSTFWRARVF